MLIRRVIVLKFSGENKGVLYFFHLVPYSLSIVFFLFVSHYLIDLMLFLKRIFLYKFLYNFITAVNDLSPVFYLYDIIYLSLISYKRACHFFVPVSPFHLQNLCMILVLKFLSRLEFLIFCKNVFCQNLLHLYNVIFYIEFCMASFADFFYLTLERWLVSNRLHTREIFLSLILKFLP